MRAPSRARPRSAPPHLLLLLALALAAAAPAPGQFGNIGLSGVGGKRFGNENLLFFVPENGDQFGRALVTGDFNGDGADDLATGIPLDDGIAGFGPVDTGAVVVRYGSPGGGLATGLAQTFLGMFVSGNPHASEGSAAFGFALAACDFDHDGRDDLAIGIPNADGPIDSGAVEVYYGSFSGLGARIELLTQATPGIPGDPEPNEYFGLSLACGDFNGDTFADLAIGVPWESFEGDGITRAGVVQVVPGSVTGLKPSLTVSLSQGYSPLQTTPETDDWFGWALATGDFNSDGIDDLAIGSPGEDGPAFGQGRGAIHIFNGEAVVGFPFGAYTQTEASYGGTPENGDQFGHTLASGDFDGDLFDDLAVGAPFQDLPGAADAGEVYVAYGRSSFSLHRPQLFTENAIHGTGASETGDRFGYALAAGDFDRDGRADLAIGGPGEFVLVAQDGMVTVIMGAPGGLSAARRHGLTAGRDGNPGVLDQADRQFGYALAAGDFDADGYADLAIGAPFEDESGRFDVGAEVVLYGSLFANGFDNGDVGFWSIAAGP